MSSGKLLIVSDKEFSEMSSPSDSSVVNFAGHKIKVVRHSNRKDVYASSTDAFELINTLTLALENRESK